MATYKIDSDLQVTGFVKGSTIVPITWSALKALRDGGKLVPGMQYRITDYTCATTTIDTSSAGNVFDIIVMADSASVLNENARAALHSRDTYFANCKLSAWKLKYCLDNDNTRFDWANNAQIIVNIDSYNSHGAPLTRQSAFDGQGGNASYPYAWGVAADVEDNDPADFVYSQTESISTGATVWYRGDTWMAEVSEVGRGVIYQMVDEYDNECPYDFKNILFTKAGSYTNAYTFSYKQSTTIKDASVSKTKYCQHNIINYYKSGSAQTLNFIVFYSTKSTFSCQGNTFDVNCNGITLGYSCSGNHFNRGCSITSLANSSNDNVFGTGCSIISFGASCSYNHVGDQCQSITFGDNVSNNILGNLCLYVTFGNSSSTIDYCRYVEVGAGCCYLYLYSSASAAYNNQVQNIHIHSGIMGSSSNNRLTIATYRGQTGAIDYYKDGSTDYMIS